MEKEPRKTCPCCQQKMPQEYEFTFSLLDALLLLKMAKAVRKLVNEGVPFTEANSVHLTESVSEANLCNRSTISSKLGLIAKHKKGGKQIQGRWVITSRGWAALRGEAVPAWVSVLTGQITERTDEKVTLASALKTYPNSGYSAAEWYDYK